MVFIQKDLIMNRKDVRPTLSLCMIVKNEEDFLTQCLESVKDIVDEMIIVDTGSSDRTIEIAKKYTDKVYFHEWEGSFSKARNQSLQYATCDWILQMDADEELEQEDIPLLKSAIKSDKYNAIYVALLNQTGDGWTKHYFQRIFRRGKAYYHGIVHNQLAYEGAVATTEIRVYHYGYNLSQDKMKAKYLRTETLLKKQLQENDNNSFAWLNYMRILRAKKDFQEAAEVGMQAILKCNGPHKDIHWQMIGYDTAYALQRIGELEKAENLCREILKKFPDNMDILFTLGGTLILNKQYADAIPIYHHFLKVHDQEHKNPKHTLLIVDTFDLPLKF